VAIPTTAVKPRRIGPQRRAYDRRDLSPGFWQAGTASDDRPHAS
jgi:hypothetical protein